MALAPIQHPYTFISDFSELEKELDVPLTKDQRGFVFFDLDHTLIQPMVLLASDKFYWFLWSLNTIANTNLDQHFRWLDALKEHYIPNSPYTPTDQNVIRVIQRFREAGWFVKIVTNRSERVAHMAKEHARSAGIVIREDEWNFRTSGSKETKGDRIQRLVGEARKNDRLVFVDDDDHNISDVKRKIEGHIYRYELHPFSDEEKHLLMVQLYGHKLREGFFLETPLPEEIHKAAHELKISHENRTVYAKTFLAAVQEILDKDASPANQIASA